MNIHPQIDNTILTGFEGPEKRLEVTFRCLGGNEVDLGLRTISKDNWQEMLNFARCTIISHMKNEDFDAFVLSESSLFVYPSKIMIKTCGTTTLLKILPKLLEYASSCNLTTEFCMFSRKNFVFPHKQVWPHNKWDSEIEILNEHFGDKGKHHIIGPLTEDHWHVYVADLSEESQNIRSEQTIEIMMGNLDTDVMNQFYKKPEIDDRAKFPGISDIIPGSETDEFNFTPCGYSMNGMYKESLYTIHITPEPQCSYVSFETNFVCADYKDMIQYIFNFFKPGTITLAYYTKGQEEPQFNQAWDVITAELPGFALRNKSNIEREGNYLFAMVNFVALDIEVKKQRAKRLINLGKTEPFTANNVAEASLINNDILSEILPVSLQTQMEAISMF